MTSAVDLWDYRYLLCTISSRFICGSVRPSKCQTIFTFTSLPLFQTVFTCSQSNLYPFSLHPSTGTTNYH